MDTQKVKKLTRIIGRAGALKVGDSPLLMGVTTYKLTGQPYNIAIRACWADDIGYEYETYFQECGLAEAQVKGNVITARDDSGAEVDITLFAMTPLDVRKEMET